MKKILKDILIILFGTLLVTGGTVFADRTSVLQNSVVNSLSVATSTDQTGNLFNAQSTSTVQVLGSTGTVIPDVGVRVSVGRTTQNGYPGTLDQLVVDGRINTTDWDQVFCDKMSNTGGSSSASNLCGQFSFADATAGSYKSVNSSTGGYAYDAISETVGAAGGDGVVFNFGSTSGGNGWFVPATSTPVMEVSARINTSTNSTSTAYYIGFINNSVTTPVVTNPTNGCFFTASSTSGGVGDWWAVNANSSTYTYVDTKIASTTVAATAGGFYRFRIESDNSHCAYYIQSSQSSNLVQVANITTNVPSTVGLSAALMGTQVTTPAGSSWELDFMRFRVWWRDFLPAL